MLKTHCLNNSNYENVEYKNIVSLIEGQLLGVRPSNPTILISVVFTYSNLVADSLEMQDALVEQVPLLKDIWDQIILR